MELKFSGLVKCGDEWRCGADEVDGALHIGGVDVVDAIAEETIVDANVYVNGTLIHENVDIWGSTGYGYSDYTPIECDEIALKAKGKGKLIDLLEELRSHVGKEITLEIKSVE